MSRETEKVLKQLMQYMEDHQDELDDGADENELAQRFMEEYNASLRPRNVVALPQTADDYMEQGGYFRDDMGDFGASLRRGPICACAARIWKY